MQLYLGIIFCKKWMFRTRIKNKMEIRRIWNRIKIHLLSIAYIWMASFIICPWIILHHREWGFGPEKHNSWHPIAVDRRTCSRRKNLHVLFFFHSGARLLYRVWECCALLGRLRAFFLLRTAHEHGNLMTESSLDLRQAENRSKLWRKFWWI